MLLFSARWARRAATATVLDEHGRWSLIRTFSTSSPGALRLVESSRYYYDPTLAPRITAIDRVEVAAYDPDGLVRRRVLRFGDESVHDGGPDRLPDPAVLTEPKPAFGRWDSMLRVDRARPVSAQPEWWLAALRDGMRGRPSRPASGR